ncbi:MAG: hypothetical protein WCJ58_04330 [bacterium]
MFWGRRKYFSFSRLLIQVFFSPLVIVVFSYLVIFNDFRKALLLSLIVVSILTVIQLVIKINSIIIASLLFNYLKVFKKLVQIIVTIIIISSYWVSYLMIWGKNFSF